MHVGGEGVTQDFDEAVRWFRLAAEQGHADAAQNLRAIEPNIEELKSGRLQINRAEDRSP
jgi:TPR repeat protein